MEGILAVTIGALILRWWWKSGRENPPKENVRRRTRKEEEKRLKELGYSDEFIAVILPTINNGE